MKYQLIISSDDPNEIARHLGALTALPSIPVAATSDDDSDDGDAGTIATIPGQLDKNGLPWDERIHARTKVITASGEWRRRRGVDDATVASVEAELRSRGAPPALPPPTLPPVAAAPPPMAAPPPVIAAPPPVAVAPVVAAPPPPPTADRSHINFAYLMARVSSSMQTGHVTADVLATVATRIGVGAITEIATDPAKIVQVYDILRGENRISE
jgi:hypothetical protein